MPVKVSQKPPSPKQQQLLRSVLSCSPSFIISWLLLDASSKATTSKPGRGEQHQSADNCLEPGDGQYVTTIVVVTIAAPFPVPVPVQVPCITAGYGIHVRQSIHRLEHIPTRCLGPTASSCWFSTASTSTANPPNATISIFRIRPCGSSRFRCPEAGTRHVRCKL